MEELGELCLAAVRGDVGGFERNLEAHQDLYVAAEVRDEDTERSYAHQDLYVAAEARPPPPRIPPAAPRWPRFVGMRLTVGPPSAPARISAARPKRGGPAMSEAVMARQLSVGPPTAPARTRTRIDGRS